MSAWKCPLSDDHAPQTQAQPFMNMIHKQLTNMYKLIVYYQKAPYILQSQTIQTYEQHSQLRKHCLYIHIA